MQVVDWIILIVFIVFIGAMALTTLRYNRTVADFLSANRCAGRYLLGVADGMAGMGAISIIATFEQTYAAGMAPVFWATISIPIGMIITLSGFVTYRYRQTRAMTMAQFFEMRYSRNFRKFAGILAWTSGIINFGLFPGVSARFFINFCGLPNEFVIAGVAIASFPVVMGILVLLALCFTLAGGQISVLVTDFWQGSIALIAIALTLGFLALSFSWADIMQGMEIASSAGNSKIDPFDIAKAAEFSIWFYMILWFNRVYNHQSWQGGSAYDTSAVNAHEQKMSRVIGQLRAMLITVGVLLIPMCGVAIMHNPAFMDIATQVNAQLSENYADGSTESEQLKKQMIVPTTLTMVLPVGLTGLFATAMLGFFISTNNTYMHSWGSIFIQDVMMPFRKKRFSPKAHLWALRFSILGTALFAYCFSLFFPVQEYIVMFFMITGAIFLGGAGSVIIGGLYWKRGTTRGAWWAMISGSTTAVGAIILRLTWSASDFLLQFGPKFPLTGAESGFIAAATACTLYIIGSLTDRKASPANFDKLFHRGAYAVESDQVEDQGRKVSIWWRIIGVNGKEFSLGDRGLYLFTFGKTVVIVSLTLAMIILHYTEVLTIEHWKEYWFYYLGLLTVLGIICGSWVSVGGFFDLIAMYRRLNRSRLDDKDDGWVSTSEKVASPTPNEKDLPQRNLLQ